MFVGNRGVPGNFFGRVGREGSGLGSDWVVEVNQGGWSGEWVVVVVVG